MTFSDTLKGTKEGEQKEIDIDDPALKEELGEDYWSQLMDEIELLDGASAEFDQDMVSKGELSPVFFGSALTNFGVETFLQHFLKMTYSPLPRNSDIGPIDPFSEDFSAFVFKIQANMNKAHRDRIAFMRICSGKFEAGMEVMHIQGGKKIRLAQPQQMMAQERHMVEEAYAGDIIGVFDPGIFSIGDTIETSAKPFRYEGIPTFAPEHFARVRQVDTMKVTKITNDNFEEEVLKSTVPVVLDFWADWCGPCKMQSPIIEEAAEAMGDRVKFGKVNVDEEAALALKYQIMSIPTLVVMKDGIFKGKAIGLQNMEAINQLVADAIKE